MMIRGWICGVALLAFVAAGFAQEHCMRILCSLEESPCATGQTFAVSLWKLDASCPSSGTICYSSSPPGAFIDPPPCESFFDVSMEPQTFEKKVGAGSFLAGECFTLVAHVVFDTVLGMPPWPDLWCEEYVCVDANGWLYRPQACPPDIIRIPTAMSVGDMFCFKVCHDVYWIPLTCTLPGPPIFTVYEGCFLSDPRCYDPECPVPDPNCYVISKHFCGGMWWLRFEYSCAYREPVCYCVFFERQLPVELLNFTALPGDGMVTLRWSTASESNNASFEIGRSLSADGDFARIAEVPGAGTSAAASFYSWKDRNVTNGTTYWYRLTSVDMDGNRRTEGSVVSATPIYSEVVVTEYALGQNFPNPFNASTSIPFDLPEAGFVALRVYNVTGQQVATPVLGEMSAGHQVVSFDAGDLPSGVYLYMIEVNGFTAQKKMLLIR